MSSGKQLRISLKTRWLNQLASGELVATTGGTDLAAWPVREFASLQHPTGHEIWIRTDQPTGKTL